MSKHPVPAPSPTAQKVWSAIRQLRRFTLTDVALTTECARQTVKHLIYLWHCHGICRPDNGGWRLAIDLGPLPPAGNARSRKGMIDRNKGAHLPYLELGAGRAHGNIGGGCGARPGRAKPAGSGRRKGLMVPIAVKRERQRRYTRTWRQRRRDRGLA